MNEHENRLGLLSSDLASREARQEFSRRLAELATTAFSSNEVFDAVQRRYESFHDLASESERLRRAVEGSPLFLKKLLSQVEQIRAMQSSLAEYQRSLSGLAALRDMEKQLASSDFLKLASELQKLQKLQKLGPFGE